ncbi:hypothetical protein DRW03_35605 [Corallococcus sp. H22C18031201]|nr:hypothetical protein DRW03_35605 [Corallococcus sp. H22C18031201]
MCTLMDTVKRQELSARLAKAEIALQWARWLMDGSPEARVMLAKAKQEYGAAEAAVLEVLGAQAALALVEDLEAYGGQPPPQ